MKHKRVLISGGAGFIGSRLALNLVEKGCRVTVLDSLSRQVHGASGGSALYRSIKGRVDFIRGDVRSKASWGKALKGQEAVVHLAAETGTGQSMYEIGKYVDVNIGGTAAMLEALSDCAGSVKKIVVASSRAVYGEGKYRCASHGVVFPGARAESDLKRGDFGVKCPRCGKAAHALPTDEAATLRSGSVYGMTKRAQEELVLLAGQTMRFATVSLRYQNVYGPGQSMANPYTGILSIFSTRILNNHGIDIYEDGSESRDFVFVDDAVRATVLALESPAVNGRALNVGSGVGTSVLTVAKTLAREFGSCVPIEILGRYRVGDIRHNSADLARVRELLGFAPRYSFARGLREFVRWVKDQRIQPDRYDKSRDELRARGLLK